jgi:DNA-binding transcriptional regulator YdaS (Cro superfamily)
MDIYVTCGGPREHNKIAEKLGTAPEKLQQYILRELPVSQKQIDAISRIME